MNARQAALEVLLPVLQDGRSLSPSWEKIAARLAARERALARELSYGVMRWLPRLEAIAAQLLRKRLKDKDRDIHIALLLGLYQIEHLNVAPHAAVSETVELAGLRGKGWARGLLNAVLRRFQREGTQILTRVDRQPAAAAAHPEWLYQAIRRDWPQQAEAILTANNQRPPMSLRVNRQRARLASLQQSLESAGIPVSPVAEACWALRLEQAVDPVSLPGFDDGHFSVQDPAAQQAAELLAPAPGERVLDACAAPGGKTAHLLELQPEIGELLALDQDPLRLQRLRDNLLRLGLDSRLSTAVADAGDNAAWWDGEPFQRILLDAPCSGTGVIRRHPDIKRLRRAEDIPRLVQTQRDLFQALWPLLARGGTLLYATCSVLAAENQQQAEHFIATAPDAEAIAIDADWGRVAGPGRQLLTGERGMDGFFYALLRKR